MRKWFLVLIAAVLALPLFGTSVLAEEVVYKDGSYQVPMVVKYGEKVFNQFSDTATIKIENDKQFIQFGHTQTNFILEVTIPDGEITSINEDEETATREVGFEYTGDFNEPVPFTIHMVYGQAHDMLAYLDMSNVPVVEDQLEVPEENPTPEESEEPTEPEEPSEPEEPTVPEKPTEPVEDELDIATLEDGSYFIKASYLHDSEDKPSAMARYLGSSIFLNVLGGKAELTITINDSEAVTLLTLDGKEAIESKVADNIRYETFSVSDLSTLHNGYVEYVAAFNGGVHHGKASFRIVLDENSISETTPSQKPGIGIEEDREVEDPTPKQPEEPVKTEKPIKPKNHGDKDKSLEPDKAYEIDYEIKHQTEDRSSAADSFFVKPAILLEKDGVYYLQVTVKGSEYINSVKNEYGEFVLVRENVDGSVVYQLKIGGKLTDTIILDMLLTVPGIYENQAHSARLILDPSSMKAIDASNYLLVASTNENGPDGDNAQDPGENAGGIPGKDDNTSGNKKLDPNTPEKPQLGDSNNINGNKSVDKNTNSSGLNPKTGEETNIMLYMLLLIASAIPLAVQLKRRFA